MTLLLTRVANATARPIANISALSRAYNALPRFQRAYVACKALQSQSPWSAARTYATSTTKKPTTKRRSTTAKKPAAKKKIAKKAKPKAKPKPKKKKVVKKVVKTKKVLSPSAKAKKERTADLADVKALRAVALEAPKGKPTSALTIFTQRSKGSITGSDALVQLQARFKALSEIEKDELEVQAKQNKLKNREAYEKWLSQHTAKQIKEANSARVSLRRKLTKLYPKRKVSARKGGLTLIQDERLVKRPANPYNIFFTERANSGAFEGQKVTETAKLIGAEYKGLSASEKKKYEDLAQADKARYAREYKGTYGENPPATRTRKSSAAS